MEVNEIVRANVKSLKNIMVIFFLITSIIFPLMVSGWITQTVSASSNNFYVSTVGSNSYNGLYPTYHGGNNGPWLTLSYAISQATNGDTIYIRSGIYTPSSTIYITQKDASNDWLTICNYNDEDVIINGSNADTSSHAFCGVFSIHKSNNIRITGLTLDYSAASGIIVNDRFSGQKHICSYIRVDNCTISNCSSVAFLSTVDNTHITFEHNLVYNNQQNWSGLLSGQECISFQRTNHFSINNNRLINNHGINIDVKGGCKNGVICYNEINNTGGYLRQGGCDFYGGSGIMLDARGISTNISIYNNHIWGNNTGISLNTESSGYYAHIKIFNNVINLNKIGAVTSVSYPEPLSLANTGLSSATFHNISIYCNTIHNGNNNNYATMKIGHASQNQLNSNNLKDLQIYNNIFSSDYAGTYYAIAGYRMMPTDIGISANSYYRSSGNLQNNWGLNTYSNLTSWNFGNSATFTDPQFEDKTASWEQRDFSLQINSPCIDTANDLLVPSFDHIGTVRPQGGLFDRGAFESITSNDNDIPQISDISIESSNPLDTDPAFGWHNITCLVTDNDAVDIVYLMVTFPDDSESYFEMVSSSIDEQYFVNISWSSPGDYSYYIFAADIYGSNNTSDSMIFSLTSNNDINSDGLFSILDLTLISNHYYKIGPHGWIREDVDNNGQVNMLDLILVSNSL